jgi:membrane protease YdiL (CAAX protease family)
MAGGCLVCAILLLVGWLGQPGYILKSIIRMGLFIGVPLLGTVLLPDPAGQSAGRQLLALFTSGSSRRRLIMTLIIGLVGTGVLFGLLAALGQLAGLPVFLSGVKSIRPDRPEVVFKLLIYIPVVNALGEEFFFRYFCCLKLASHLPVQSARLYSAVLFAVYHLSIMRDWFSWPLLSICLGLLFVAGWILGGIAAADRHLLRVWLLHGLANLIILVPSIGFAA